MPFTFSEITWFLQFVVLHVFGFMSAVASRDMVHFYNKEQRRKGGVEIKLLFFDRSYDPLPQDLDISTLEPFTQSQIHRYRFWRRLCIGAMVLLVLRFVAGAMFK